MKTKNKIFLLFIIISGIVTVNVGRAQNPALAIVFDEKSFYWGIATPVAKGVAADKKMKKINNDTIIGTNGKYIVKIAKKYVNKLVGDSVGEKKDAKNEFIVNIPKYELEKIDNIFFGFEYFSSQSLNVKVYFEVYSFNLSRISRGEFINDMQYYNISDATKAMKVLFKSCKRGEKISISNIQIKTPDGLRLIPGINIKVE